MPSGLGFFVCRTECDACSSQPLRDWVHLIVVFAPYVLLSSLELRSTAFSGRELGGLGTPPSMDLSGDLREDKSLLGFVRNFDFGRRGLPDDQQADVRQWLVT